MWWPYRPDVYEEGKNELLAFTTNGRLITSAAEERGKAEMAADLLNHFHSEESESLSGEYGNTLPNHVDAGDTLASPVHEELHAQITAEETTPAMRVDDILIPEFRQALIQNTEQFLTGDMGLEEVLINTHEAWEGGMEDWEN